MSYANGSTRGGRSTRGRKAALAAAAAVPPAPMAAQIMALQAPNNPPKSVLPTSKQALSTTYFSRMRTGPTLLMQPIITQSVVPLHGSSIRTSRRGGVVNYADPPSGDELPDAGALDSDDSDFVASGGTRTSIRYSTRTRNHGTPQPVQQPVQQKSELDQSYLGMIPPEKFIRLKVAVATPHEYPSESALNIQASKPTSLIPIRVEFETDSHRIRDCFVWNLHETLIKPETFAKTFCADLDLPIVWAETVANQIRAQIEEHEGIASMDLHVESDGEDEIPECRVIVSIDVQIATHHLLDHIEWDLLSPLTPETYARNICADLGLSGEAIPLIAHAVHEELIKHKKDAVEWGVIGGDVIAQAHASLDNDSTITRGQMKDKTGLGMGWGRARASRDKEGRGPRVLRSVWREWAEAEEFTTRFEVLTAEEVERREIEKERGSRRLRRETSKFQSTRSSRRRG